jgi:hypothetical protein
LYEIDKDDDGYYDVGTECEDDATGIPDCTFGTDYPWMWWTAYNNLLASAQIRVDTSTITGGIGGGTQE